MPHTRNAVHLCWINCDAFESLHGITSLLDGITSLLQGLSWSSAVLWVFKSALCRPSLDQVLGQVYRIKACVSLQPVSTAFLLNVYVPVKAIVSFSFVHPFEEWSENEKGHH